MSTCTDHFGFVFLILFTHSFITVECCCEFGCGLLTVYIDLKEVLDLVHYISLWEILRHRELLTKIIGLIASLYIGTESAEKSGGGPLYFIHVKLGVRQGCVLFNTCVD